MGSSGRGWIGGVVGMRESVERECEVCLFGLWIMENAPGFEVLHSDGVGGLVSL